MPNALCRAAAVATVLIACLPGFRGAAQSEPAPEPPEAQTTPTIPAGTETPAPQSEFFDTIDVDIVNVDVYVTDKKGNRIRGLTVDDFELYEDKKPIAITNFFAVDEGAVVAPSDDVAGEAPAPAAPVPAPGPPTAAEIPEDQRLHLVVYIDNWNIKPFNRNRVFTGLREFLRNRLSPGDRVMLMTYDREQHVRRPFTADPSTVASALFEIEKLSANGTRIEGDRREVIQAIEEAEESHDAYPQVRSYAESMTNDLSFSIDSIKDLVASLAGLPGRKAILYVSDGLELVPGEDLFHALHEKFKDATGVLLEARTFDLSRRFQELISSANSNRISFYTIDAGGLRTASSSSVESQQAGNSGYIDSIYWSNLQSSIQMMAERTGGLAIYNTNDPGKVLPVVAADFRNYYSLGYSPAHGGDGRYHPVEVKIRGRKDLVVRHRDGYRDKPLEIRMADGVGSALAFDVESNPLELAIERGAEARRQDGYFEVEWLVRGPIEKLTLVPRGDRQVAKIRLFFAAQDENGGKSDVQNLQIPFEIPTAQYETSRAANWSYPVRLVMRAGVQKLAVGLRDEIGQVSSFKVRTVRVGG